MKDLKFKSFFENLRLIFLDNFRLTRLYSTYLEHFPEAITPALVSPLLECGLAKEEALAALISQLFGLDTENSPEDRRLYRDYVIPSVRILDANKYRNNPYYKNIKIPEVKYGSWELKRESYAPYRAIICDDMVIHEDFREIAPLGFFEEEFEFPAVLEGGNEWMTLTPVDLDTCEKAIEAASGRVVTFGLGLGYFAYMAAMKSEVSSVTVVEKSREVISLFEKYVLPLFGSEKKKINIVNIDAFEYAEQVMPSLRFDYAFVDTWRDASDGAPMYIKMKKLEHLCPGTRFDYWIENFLKSKIRADRFSELLSLYEKGELDKTKEEILDMLK